MCCSALSLPCMSSNTLACFIALASASSPQPSGHCESLLLLWLFWLLLWCLWFRRGATSRDGGPSPSSGRVVSSSGSQSKLNSLAPLRLFLGANVEFLLTSGPR